MDRRSFLKLLGGIASLPIMGRVFKLGKPASQIAEEVSSNLKQQGMPDFFYELVSGVKRFGKKTESSRDYDVYKFTHPETKQSVEVIDGPGETAISFETDKGFRGEMGVKKGQADEMTKGQTPPDEYYEGEEVYRGIGGDGYTKDFEEGIEGGYQGLESLAKKLKEDGQMDDGFENIYKKMRESGDYDFAEGGIASGPPPKKGPNSQGLETLFETR